MRRAVLKPLLAALILGAAPHSALGGEGENPGAVPRFPGFNRDVRPILSENCFACHGPDPGKRKAGLRLDAREGLFGKRRKGPAVAPGRPGESELYLRITTENARKRMPPPKSGKALTASQVELLRRWIESGAAWEGHWSYAPLVRPRVPEAERAGFVRNDVDRFVLEKLGEKGLEPSPEADRTTLIRRLSFDLTGLPPSWEEVEAFGRDPAEDACERLVSRLLASPHYGERMAVHWLDLVRYADTTGIHGDNHRDVAPYRDYVIAAFNRNKPFDRFTLEQLAGDLLPDAGIEEKVGSGYNRMNMTTAEGGAQAKEYLAKYSADRVRNGSAVWLGATLGCAECHDHKFDPYTTRDFYRFAAFFADLHEEAVALPGPPFPVPSPEQAARLKDLEGRIASLKKILVTPTPEVLAAQAAWEAENRERLIRRPKLDPWHSIGPFEAPGFEAAHATAFEPEREVDLSKGYADGSLRWKARPGYEDGKVHKLKGRTAANYLHRALHAPEAVEAPVSLGSDDGLKLWLNGELVLDRKVERAAAADQEKLTLKLRAGENRLLLKVSNAGNDTAFYFKLLDEGARELVVAALKKPAAERTAAEQDEVAAHYRSLAPLLEPARKSLAALEREKGELDGRIPKTLVSMTVAPRAVRVLPRGNWLDESGEEVTPAIPVFLGTLPVGDRRATRLDLARWLVARDNPLTARVFVNRLWKLLFGAALARTSDDLGSQGAWPTHPELLDWLAAEFVESGWDVKRMVRLLALSGTYRQQSLASPELRERDPYNLYLARQSTFRLDAEAVRDSALAVSGLLVRTVGGASVKPYQPAGYWGHLNFPVRTYEHDRGESQHRRGLYTYWCRTFLHPSFQAFDAPTREECTADRPRSNTPLQALVLLNDPSYVEAARVFAARVLEEGGAGVEERLRWAFRRALARDPRAEEAAVLRGLLEKHLREYARDPKGARETLGVGEAPVAAGLDQGELAAWASVARTILNLHETVTRS